MNYSKFQVEDFATDEYFIKWVKRPDAETDAFWNAWMSGHPENIARVRQAREIVLQLDFKTNIPPEGRFLEVWEKIVKAQTESSFTYTVTSDTQKSRKNWYYAVAAAVIFLIAAPFAFLIYEFRLVTIATQYGESRTITLPDSTKVTLNSNSSLSFSPARFSRVRREVSLQGEAFFSVVHKVNNQNFIVHTDELNVEVLGTKFNVNTRRGNTKVILKEGKVMLNMVAHEKPDSLIMEPGEYVEFTEAGSLTRKNVDVNDYLEWRNNRLIFVGTSLMEISQLLEDNYGYQVIFQNDSLKYRKFTGSSSVVEIDELLDKLSRLYNLEVQKTGNKIVLKHNSSIHAESK